MFIKEGFDKLVKFFQDNGYDVVESLVQAQTCLEPEFEPYYFALISGKGLKAGFCTSNNGSSYSQLDGKIAIENDFAFDKWNKCPAIIELPVENLSELLKLCEFLGTNEGEKYSKTFAYLNDPEWDQRIKSIV